MNTTTRKIVSFELIHKLNNDTDVICLCNDGTLWLNTIGEPEWMQLQQIPQPGDSMPILEVEDDYDEPEEAQPKNKDELKKELSSILLQLKSTK